MQQIRKYPRTRHLAGSSLQTGDHDLGRVPFSHLRGRRVVYEEKLDGANSGFFFDAGGRIHGQSRGHELDLSQRGGRERHFNYFKDWLNAHSETFLDRLEDRYVVYGEWMHASHTVYYDALPHLFMEFDVLDTASGTFLSTEARAELLRGLPIVSVPVLYDGEAMGEEHLRSLIRPSLYKTEHWRHSLAEAIRREGLDPVRTMAKIEGSDLSEGIYVKVEEDGRVVERLKFVRAGFIQHVMDIDEHWLSRPILPNVLAPGVDIFAQPVPPPFAP